MNLHKLICDSARFAPPKGKEVPTMVVHFAPARLSIANRCGNLFVKGQVTEAPSDDDNDDDSDSDSEPNLRGGGMSSASAKSGGSGGRGGAIEAMDSLGFSFGAEPNLRGGGMSSASAKSGGSGRRGGAMEAMDSVGSRILDSRFSSSSSPIQSPSHEITDPATVGSASGAIMSGKSSLWRPSKRGD